MSMIVSTGKDRTFVRPPASRKVTSGCHRHTTWDFDCNTCKRAIARETANIARQESREIASTRNNRYGR